MPDQDKNNDITINLKESSLAEFTKRPLPSKQELKKFEEALGKEQEKEQDFDVIDDDKEEEIEESLSEIYQDDQGRLVDVKHLQKSQGHGFVFWFVSIFILLSLAISSGYFVYSYFYLPNGSDASKVELNIEAETEVVAGEEFFYEIKYRNPMNIALRDLALEVKYPADFIFLDSYPKPVEDKDSIWRFDRLGPQAAEAVKIRGKIIGPESQTGIFFASLSFEPENFSSEFTKEASITTAVKDIGLNLDFDYSSNALVNEKDRIFLYANALEKSFINSFRLSVDLPSNASLKIGDSQADDALSSEEIRPGVWNIGGISSEKKKLPLELVFSEKIDNKQMLEFVFEHDEGEAGRYEFFRQPIEFEVMKSDLNLTAIVNGSRTDQGVNFGDTLNYSIVYSNKGEADMKDVVIMAVLESDFLDWTSLDDPQGGIEKGNTITWTKSEIPQLELIEPNSEGTIDFSIKLSGLGDSVEDKEFQVKSFAQFSVGSFESEEGEEIEGVGSGEDNKSNIIINKINSDLGISESVRYFSEDNIPVGTGPHPPRVGEETTYKVYWELTNNLHELEDLKVSAALPANVFWDGKERSTAGGIEYDPEANAVVWDIGRLPVTVFQTNAEFSIKVKPLEENKNQIMVLLGGSETTAVDSETGAELNIKTKAKTTRLEDDEIAAGDGIVQ